MGSKKKKTVVLDFSTAQTGPKPSEFEVEDYDYEQRQRQKKTGFDEDLEFLLSQEHSSDGKSGNSAKSLRGSAGKNAHGTPSSTSESSEANRDTALDVEQISSKVGEIGTKKTKKKALHKEVQRTTRKEITGDLGDIEFSSDDEVSDAQRVKKEKKEKRKKEKKEQKEQKEKEEQEAKSSEPEPNFVPFEELVVPQPAAKKDRKKKKKSQKQKSPEHVTSSTGTESDAPVVSRPSSEPPATPKADQTGAENAKPKSKKKKASKQKAADAAADAAATGNDTKPPHADADANAATDAATDANAAVTEIPQNSPPVLHGSRQIRETTPVKDVQPPKRSPSPRPESAASKSSPSKATLVKQLPAVQPVSTIFGLSHDQICKTKLSDVKIKTIVNVPMSKMCKNALQFVLAETEGLFLDPAKTSQFVDLCVNVALHEAPGFNEVTKRIPQLLDWIPHCEPLLLSHTKTNVTLSTKSMHQNSLDYTVFSFFGHILIWACELQYAEKQETIFEKYELGISRPQILNSLGGYHLWDRLRRDKTINTKRWKHIQKFRQIFAFEEHQFVLILRCLNLGVTIC